MPSKHSIPFFLHTGTVFNINKILLNVMCVHFSGFVLLPAESVPESYHAAGTALQTANLVVELAVGVASEKHCPDLWKHLLGQHLQTGFQGVGDLDAVTLGE